ncbi:purine-nucleoside phosphorylase [Methylobacterium sp. WL30]|uniref:purine-nucleoside phosphorylase n=1 Tax=unclassified Methylobacterium TaxID=2615210 RepID=UPI0011C9F5EF|nr:MULTISPECIES: purine-nucleoside phosphorylase [unclassified Methylobacterium]TXM90275.1 purine-nucleoside phosphorylase [Methylobacterium sp. WL116]TXN34114.1 purine-nucleoside phosphorylase [Methylobacterium sp. WL93]TXN44979.1 purine-nucleoside phosphorylase [Methylobacterium sp. WL119]TXN63203.1 purine-nucleoside phosphorylase [Methylobacterium sp. WL30]
MADAVETLRAAGFAGPYACAIVAGTGLGGLADALADAVSLPYADIPGFPGAGVSGHRGRLHRGVIAGRPVLVLEGRAHAYEHGDAAAMRIPIAAAMALGAACLLLTNASGSLMPEAGPGSLVRLSDHLNLSGMNPLIGEPSDARFVPMVRAYDPALNARLDAAAAACGIPLPAGVYAWFSGPSFETPAEVRMAGRLGADLVGMSTVPEVILARFLGLPVAAVSVVTNRAAGIGDGDPHHAETKQAATAAAADLIRLIRSFVAALPAGDP